MTSHKFIHFFEPPSSHYYTLMLCGAGLLPSRGGISLCLAGAIVGLILPTLSVEYLDQLLGAARQVHVVYLAQLLGAVLFIHFISNHDRVITYLIPQFTKNMCNSTIFFEF